MTKDNEYAYERLPDGAVRLKQTTHGEPFEGRRILSQWRSLRNQEKHLEGRLDKCRSRLEALRPFVDEELAARVEAARGSPLGPDDAVDAELNPPETPEEPDDATRLSNDTVP